MQPSHQHVAPCEIEPKRNSNVFTPFLLFCEFLPRHNRAKLEPKRNSNVFRYVDMNLGTRVFENGDSVLGRHPGGGYTGMPAEFNK